MILVLSVCGSLVALAVLLSIFGKPEKPQTKSRALQLFELQEAVKVLGEYPSTIGDKQRLLSEMERLLGSGPIQTDEKPGFETFIPCTPSAMLQRDLFSACKGSSAQVEKLAAAGNWREATVVATAAIQASYEVVQPDDYIRIGQKLPAQGVLGFAFDDFRVTVRVVDTRAGELLPSEILGRAVYYVVGSRAPQRVGEPRWDADLIENPWTRKPAGQRIVA